MNQDTPIKTQVILVVLGALVFCGCHDVRYVKLHDDKIAFVPTKFTHVRIKDESDSKPTFVNAICVERIGGEFDCDNYLESVNGEQYIAGLPGDRHHRLLGEPETELGRVISCGPYRYYAPVYNIEMLIGFDKVFESGDKVHIIITCSRSPGSEDQYPKKMTVEVKSVDGEFESICTLTRNEALVCTVP